MVCDVYLLMLLKAPEGRSAAGSAENTSKPPEPYFVYTTDLHQIRITAPRPLLIDTDIRKTWYVAASPVAHDNLAHHLHPFRPPPEPSKRSVSSQKPCQNFPTHSWPPSLDRRQDSLCPPGCRDPRIHHPPPQARARPLLQKARPLGRQVRDRLRPKGDGHIRCATRPQAQPGCLGPGN
jgi:hypothetical protein